MMRRATFIASITVLTVVMSAGVATAGELDDYLAEAADASFAGQQATWCSYGGKTEFSIVSVEHAGQAVMVESGGSSQILAGGKASATGSENGLSLANWSSVEVADRYVIAEISTEVRVGR